MNQLPQNPVHTDVIFTAIYGDKNDLLEPAFDIPGCDLVCFTDNPNLTSTKFHIEVVPPLFANPQLAAKPFKLVPHHYLPMYKRSFWIDGRVQLQTSQIKELLDTALQTSPWAGFIHNERSSVRAEADACIEWQLDKPEIIEAQLARYTHEGFPDTAPLLVGGLIMREHMHPEVIKIGEQWWHEVLTGSIRDQLSMNYAFWKYQFTPHILHDNFRDNAYVKVLKHKWR